ncbi:hypothetical protein, partial [Glaesserella parasuis]|uniref:hypothetical protein n=1 Tax=Glaesserella parasuis TaxID=738 RepID=UPI0039E75EFA
FAQCVESIFAYTPYLPTFVPYLPTSLLLNLLFRKIPTRLRSVHRTILADVGESPCVMTVTAIRLFNVP